MAAVKQVLRFLLLNLFSSLGYLLGSVQAVVVHWLGVALGGGGLGWGHGALLAVALTGANALMLPFLRRARRQPGWGRGLARLYVSTGLVSLLLGAAVLLSYLAFAPVAVLLQGAAFAPGAIEVGFRVTSGLLVGGTALLLAWGFSFGQARIEHTRIDVSLPGLAPLLDGLRLVQISDLHIGNGMEGRRLGALVERVNGHEADVVAITGDIFDFDPHFIEEGVRGLAGLRARHGVYAVLGNHDGYTGVERIAAAFDEHAPDIRLLRGDCVRLPTAAPLYVAGIDDPGFGWSERDYSLPALDALAERLPADGPAILLIHRPDGFSQAARLGFPLVLAGHTHGGQIALPTPGGVHNIARLIYRHHRGVYRDGDALLYVNRGVGVAGPAIRLNCSREIATVQLRAIE